METHRITRVGSSQEIELDIRIIASTNRRLEQLAAEGAFRQDLFYRLNVLKLEIPPLRARPGDIGLCAEQFLERLNGMSGEAERHMTPEFLTGLTEYDWPGNVRELQNTIERTFYSSAGEELDAQSLRSALGPAPENAPAPHAHGGETRRAALRAHPLRRRRGRGRQEARRQPRHPLPPHQALRHRRQEPAIVFLIFSIFSLK